MTSVSEELREEPGGSKESGKSNTTENSAAVLACSLSEINTMAKGDLGRKKFMWFACPNHSRSLREVMADIQAGTEPGTVEGCCLPTCLPLFARLAF